MQASVTRFTKAADGSLGDVAHRTDSFFQVATEVLEARASDQLFLQVHGFELKKHDDAVPKGTQVILSDANDAPRDDPRFTAFAVEAENFESIHNHSAYARIARGM